VERRCPTSRFAGYDGIPVESMQGLDINSSTNLYNDNNLTSDFVNFETNVQSKGANSTDPSDPETPLLVNNPRRALPNLPRSTQNENSTSQLAAWYDTDL